MELQCVQRNVHVRIPPSASGIRCSVESGASSKHSRYLLPVQEMCMAKDSFYAP